MSTEQFEELANVFVADQKLHSDFSTGFCLPELTISHRTTEHYIFTLSPQAPIFLVIVKHGIASIELRTGLLKKLRFKDLEDLVAGATRKDTSGNETDGKGESVEEDDDGENWKNGLLKKAAVTLVDKLAR
ncbi:hypothetical protein TruAng_006534 [Truncatella angustata]|nr:hypothetical protein TruAng_006534 [Truncatella angustata]